MSSDFDRWFVSQFGKRPPGTPEDLRHAAVDATHALAQAQRARILASDYAEQKRVARYAWNAAKGTKDAK
jgi:hypothetical protein